MPAPPTEFASAERADQQVILEQVRQLAAEVRFQEMLDRVPDMVLVLNPSRQVVYANRAALRFFQVADVNAIAGKRPGELFHCAHAAEAAGCCGTTRFCRFCGAVDSILRAQQGEFAVEECRMLVDRRGAEEALDLRVWASPIAIAGLPFTVFIVVNIADEKRRLWLEKVFLHDLMNTATALRGFSWLLDTAGTAAPLDHDHVHAIGGLVERIINEIDSHRQLMAAENNELHISPRKIDSREIVDEVYAAYNNRDLLNGRALRIDGETASVVLQTDPTLLVRVLGNMVKNALESSAAGELVTLGCRHEDGKVAFWVHNPTYIPENIQLQIFNRSFSTKGRGRGLGTYSMKLLSERYLHGRVSFVSRHSAGTTFVARFPLSLP